MDYSIQSTALSSLGMRGSLWLTGGQTVANTNGFIGFRSVDGTVILGGISGLNMSGVSYLAGRSLAHPCELLGPITNISLNTGSAAIQLFY